jgi:hypothetical protein
VIVSHQHLEEFLVILHEVSHGYELIMNPNKHMILAVKKHHRITDEMDLRGLSIMIAEYCYFRVKLDMSQAYFTLTWKKDKKPCCMYFFPYCNYLRANMWYYSKDLSFENQYSLWSAYVIPYYINTAPVIETQTQIIQKRFQFL